LAAYVDLIQTAEYAFPSGAYNADIMKYEIEDPLKVSIWRKVQLGGRYYLEPDEMPVNILINLTGKRDGYIVEKCWIAQEEEFLAFEENLKEFQKILRNYYNVFVE
ncbi:MAG: hypothetical protein HWN67_17770, partial [Candidatus Helarchaeota archaeon]|nr:hypothetical protein [Candidatus Helarchaeota archaeon]